MVNIVDNTWHRYDLKMIEMHKKAITPPYIFPIKNWKPRKTRFECSIASNQRLDNAEPYPSRIRKLLQRRYG
jgi:hypothetical protein